jgi:hypothetical protein
MPILHNYGATADALISALEATDCAAHTTRAHNARWLLPLLQLCTGAAVLVGRRMEQANR